MASPLSTLVDILPVIQYIPGLQLREHGKQLKKELQVAANGPYEFAKQQLDNGDDRQSYVSKLIKCCRASAQSIEIPIEDELGIKWTAVVMYLAGVETTATALHSFILAMVLFPGVQEKAQEEIDRVIGLSRFPDLADRENLPYIDSLVKEIHRWSPVTPLGLPHAASQNISYNNFTIPQGSILLPAVWWFLHDPQRYQNPDVFEPERFLYPRNEPDSTAIAFGFGRRICPGRHFADTSIFINVARILSAFEIKKAVNPQGVEVDPILQLQPGVLPGLRDFPVHIKPRSASKRDTIELMQLRLPAETNNATFLNRMYC
ncbi:hypothetical protein PWT90_05938 [Aphanocladium album]|nr:hypothetical protein PWT90_05938 [Aphanocladium album]